MIEPYNSSAKIEGSDVLFDGKRTAVDVLAAVKKLKLYPLTSRKALSTEDIEIRYSWLTLERTYVLSVHLILGTLMPFFLKINKKKVRIRVRLSFGLE